MHNMAVERYGVSHRKGRKKMIRLFFALCFFFLGVYLLFDLFESGFSFLILSAAMICFVVAHYLKPKKREADDHGSLYDLVDLIIDIPSRVIVISLRSIGRLFKGDADGIDL